MSLLTIKGVPVVVSAQDVPMLLGKRWAIQKDGYAARAEYNPRKKNNRTVMMHREIMGRVPRGFEVDHINGDRLDNRRENLRLATRSQNNANAILRKDNKAGARGVSFDVRSGKWCASIAWNGRREWLGRHKTKAAARRAYSARAKALHGDFYKRPA